jgi:hypothetical protein
VLVVGWLIVRRRRRGGLSDASDGGDRADAPLPDDRARTVETDADGTGTEGTGTGGQAEGGGGPEAPAPMLEPETR